MTTRTATSRVLHLARAAAWVIALCLVLALGVIIHSRRSNTLDEWRVGKDLLVRATCVYRSLGLYDVQVRVLADDGVEVARGTLFRSVDSRADCRQPDYRVQSASLSDDGHVLSVRVREQEIAIPVRLGELSLAGYDAPVSP